MIEKGELGDVLKEMAGGKSGAFLFVKGEYFGNWFDLLRKSVTLEFWELLDENDVKHQFWKGGVIVKDELGEDGGEEELEGEAVAAATAGNEDMKERKLKGQGLPAFLRPYKYKLLRTYAKLKNGGPGGKLLLVFLAAPKTLILASPILFSNFAGNLGVSGITALEIVVIPLAALVGIFTVVKNQVSENKPLNDFVKEQLDSLTETLKEKVEEKTDEVK